jgi:hypothetical protein
MLHVPSSLFFRSCRNRKTQRKELSSIVPFRTGTGGNKEKRPFFEEKGEFPHAPATRLVGEKGGFPEEFRVGLRVAGSFPESEGGSETIREAFFEIQDSGRVPEPETRNDKEWPESK